MEKTESAKMNMTVFLHAVRRFWLLIVLFCLFGAACGWGFAVWRIKPQYKATALIFVSVEPNAAADGYDAGISNAGKNGNNGVQDENVSSQLLGYQLLRYQLTIGNLLIPDFQALLNSHKLRKEVEDRWRSKYPGQALAEYTLTVQAVPKTRFMKISAVTTDRNAAPLIANEVVSVLKDEAGDLFGTTNAKVVDQARSASKKSLSPMLYLIYGLLLGMAASLLLVFCIDFFDKSIRDMKDLEEKLKLPLLGVLPVFDGNTDNKLWGADVQSVYGESIRSLRGSIKYLLPESGRARIFSVTSVDSGEGKSSVISNLALAAGQVEKRVLLLDMDLRRPSLHRIFRLSNKTGVVDLLASKKSFDELVYRNVEVEGLDVLCCGTIPVNPADLLSSRNLEAFLKEQSENYDYIFIDAPPCLGIYDATTLGNLADSTFVVCDYRNTNTDKLRMVIERLRKAHVHVGGLVINRFKLHNRNDYGYDYQHYYSQYSPEKTQDDADTGDAVES